ncbi:hypothetical protein N0V90_012547 [Kalmusia sp. IMI 367209]|nr:hypothetical protein N0V90_012547 [Kalmusia sp. IMI 367209]
MLSNPGYLAIAAMSAIASLARPAYGQSSNITLFAPPAPLPFLHIELAVAASTFVTDLDGTTGQANNQGGNITGAFSGEILKLGTEFETYPTIANFTESLYDNVFTVNTTDGTPILMSISAHIHYTENALGGASLLLHGFGRIEFQTDSKNYLYLNYGDYIAEFEAVYPSGHASMDVFELKSSGHRA